MGAFEDVVRQLLDARGWCDFDGNHSDTVSVSCETLGRWYDELVRAHDMDMSVTPRLKPGACNSPD